jgi:hypothetical protein
MRSKTLTPNILINSMQFSVSHLTRYALLVALSALVALVAWVTSQSLSEPQIYSLASVLATLSITTVGFVFTAASIFAALFTRDLVQKLMRTGHFRDLVALLFFTAIVFLISAVISFCAMFTSGSTLFVVVSAAIGFAFSALLLFCVAGYRFYLVLSNVE